MLVMREDQLSLLARATSRDKRHIYSRVVGQFAYTYHCQLTACEYHCGSTDSTGATQKTLGVTPGLLVAERREGVSSGLCLIAADCHAGQTPKATMPSD